jgi:hypothetical protein
MSLDQTSSSFAQELFSDQQIANIKTSHSTVDLDYYQRLEATTAAILTAFITIILVKRK